VLLDLALNLRGEGTTIVNNIIADSYYGLISSGPTSVLAHLEADLTHNMEGVRRSYMPDEFVTDAPVFEDPSAGDFNLAWNSPGLDQGVRSSESRIDIDGTARPIDGDQDEEALFDIGAHESAPERTRVRFVRWREISGHREMDD